MEQRRTLVHRYVAVPSTIYANRVQGKTAIYLDTNVWSDLSEEATDDARVARQLLLDAHWRGAVVCPLAFPTITELLKRAINADSMRQGDLMDVLSGGVTFRGPAHIREVETRAACDFMLSGQATSLVAQVFTITGCYESDKRVAFPDGWTDTEADEYMSKLEQGGSPSVRWLQASAREPEYLSLQATTDEKYVREISRKRSEATTWAVDNAGKLDATKLRLEEHTCVLNRYIMENAPRLVGGRMFVRLVPHLYRLGTDSRALKAVVAEMPSTWLSCEMNVQRMLANSLPTEKQDFYDHEHAALALPYTQAFVTSDGGILDILRKVRATKRFSCRLIRGITELRHYVAELAAA
jgi:hypothetical protein